MADRRWSSGQGPDDRVTGQRLQNWAIACGSFVIRSDAALLRLQEEGAGAESTIIEETYALLVDLLRGNSSADSGHIRASGQQYPYPTGIDTVRLQIGRLGQFDGSENAREMAVLELSDRWDPVARYLGRTLIRVFQNALLDAYGRTPAGTTLETDTDEIKRLRRRPHLHEHVINQGMVGNITFKAGQTWGRITLVDIYKTLGSRSQGMGTFWAHVSGHPTWYYRGNTNALDRNTVVGEVARGVAENAKFAGLLFPKMIQFAGFALSFSPNPVMIIAGVVLEKLGEEGVRDLSGEGRKFEDVASEAAQEILISLVMNKIFGGSKGSSGTKAGQKLGVVADAAADRARDAVKKEIVSTEAPHLAQKLESGQARRIREGPLSDEGYKLEVEIAHDGGRHTYRQKANGEWCRWSQLRLCALNMGSNVDDAARDALRKGEHPITTDFDPRSEKLAQQGRGTKQTVFDKKKASADLSDQAEVYAGELFQKNGYKVHYHADDAAGDLSIDGVRADVKRLAQKRSIGSAVQRGAGQAPNVIIDGTQVALTREESINLIKAARAEAAKHPGKYRDLRIVYIIDGSATNPDVYIYHWHGAGLHAPDPNPVRIREAGSRGQSK